MMPCVPRSSSVRMVARSFTVHACSRTPRRLARATTAALTALAGICKMVVGGVYLASEDEFSRMNARISLAPRG